MPQKPGGVFLGIDGGLRPIFQILTLFQSKQKVIFHTRFQTWSLQVRFLARK